MQQKVPSLQCMAMVGGLHWGYPTASCPVTLCGGKRQTRQQKHIDFCMNGSLMAPCPACACHARGGEVPFFAAGVT